MLNFSDTVSTLSELFQIHSRLEAEYSRALMSYFNSCSGSTGEEYHKNMALFLGEILGYKKEKILDDIKAYKCDKEKHKC
jgi:hypothetical protein